MLVLWPLSYFTDIGHYDSATGKLTSPSSIPILPNTRCVAYNGGIWFFNGDAPYMGSVIHLSDDNGIGWEGGIARSVEDRRLVAGPYGCIQTSFIGSKGEFVGRDRAADFPGIYFRHFEWWNWPQSWTTLRISLWLPLILFAIGPVSWLLGRASVFLGTKRP